MANDLTTWTPAAVDTVLAKIYSERQYKFQDSIEILVAALDATGEFDTAKVIATAEKKANKEGATHSYTGSL